MGAIVDFIGVNLREWLNGDLKNTLPKDFRVSCLSDTGFVSLPELTGGDGDAG